jgi:hypothetical protein
MGNHPRNIPPHLQAQRQPDKHHCQVQLVLIIMHMEKGASIQLMKKVIMKREELIR